MSTGLAIFLGAAVYLAGALHHWLLVRAREALDQKIARQAGLEKVVVYRPLSESPHIEPTQPWPKAQHRPPPPGWAEDMQENAAKLQEKQENSLFD